MMLLDSKEWLMVMKGYLRPDCEEQYKGVYFGGIPLDIVQELRKLWQRIRIAPHVVKEGRTARKESGISMLM